MNLHDAAQNRNAAKGVLTQENIGFGLTILAPSAFKKPGNPSGLPGFFHATIRPKLPGQNCFAPLKQKLGLQSKEKCRRHPLWLSRRFDDAMRPNFCFRGNVFLRQRAFRARAFFQRPNAVYSTVSNFGERGRGACCSLCWAQREQARRALCWRA